MTCPSPPSPSEQRLLCGRALVLGDHVNADLLHPPAFFSLDVTRLRAGFLAGLGRETDASSDGTTWIVVAGRNFGCGSSRETTVDALRRGGVVAVVAPSFGRIFRRTAAALGVPCFVSQGSLAEVLPDEELVLDAALACLVAGGGARRIALEAPDPFLEAVHAAGGLLEWLGHRRS
ncbi:MAG: hypothetical protein IPK07_09925 [Deltaproteobacteria bacterium]|nr:hypothetical protein [Deltaproteobacteria bacterium]